MCVQATCLLLQANSLFGGRFIGEINHNETTISSKCMIRTVQLDLISMSLTVSMPCTVGFCKQVRRAISVPMSPCAELAFEILRVRPKQQTLYTCDTVHNLQTRLTNILAGSIA